MLARFNPSPIWNAHLKGLMNRKYTTERPVGVPDAAARALLYVAPLVAGVVMFFFDGKVAGTDGLLAAAGIFTGALFMAFTQVASWRQMLSDRRHEREVAEVAQRDSLDEAVAHLLMAMYASVALAVVIVSGRNFADAEGRLTSGWAAATAALGVYTALLLLIVMPKLYSAYVEINEVDDEMSGLSR